MRSWGQFSIFQFPESQDSRLQFPGGQIPVSRFPTPPTRGAQRAKSNFQFPVSRIAGRPARLEGGRGQFPVSSFQFRSAQCGSENGELEKTRRGKFQREGLKIARGVNARANSKIPELQFPAGMSEKTSPPPCAVQGSSSQLAWAE